MTKLRDGAEELAAFLRKNLKDPKGIVTLRITTEETEDSLGRDCDKGVVITPASGSTWTGLQRSAITFQLREVCAQIGLGHTLGDMLDPTDTFITVNPHRVAITPEHVDAFKKAWKGENYTKELVAALMAETALEIEKLQQESGLNLAGQAVSVLAKCLGVDSPQKGSATERLAAERSRGGGHERS